MLPESSAQKAARTAAILFLPALAGVLGGELAPGDIGLNVWDKALHFTAYFVLASLATLALRSGRKVLLAVLALVAMGGALEIIQGFIGRDADIMDELANTLGACGGYLVGWLAMAILVRIGGAD
jgi:VanZ family protein